MKSIVARSPVAVFGLIIFICEAIVMAILHAFGLRGIWDIVLDPLLLSVLLTPIMLRILPPSHAARSSLPEDGAPAPVGSSRWTTVCSPRQGRGARR